MNRQRLYKYPFGDIGEPARAAVPLEIAHVMHDQPACVVPRVLGAPAGSPVLGKQILTFGKRR